MPENLRRNFLSQILRFFRLIHAGHYGVERFFFQISKPDSRFFGQFLLISFHKFSKTLIDNSGEDIDIFIVYSVPALVHRYPKPPPYFLLPSNFRGPHFLELTYLKDIWVVPALFQRRVRKNKSGRFLKTQQPLLILHD